MEPRDEYGAFVEKFILQTPPPPGHLPLQGLTFAVKDIFEVQGYVTGFGNPDWAKTHPPANSTAPTVECLLKAGATCVGTTVMDEMAYSINGENVHYGTPRNPVAADRIPGGSSSGSAVAVGANLVDFSLGTDTGGSVRAPASFCGILGEYDVLAIPTVPGPPPKLKTDPSLLEGFRNRAFSLLSIAGVSGFCQVSIPLGLDNNLPVSISLLARHGSDKFLLNLVESLHGTLKEQSRLAEEA